MKTYFIRYLKKELSLSQCANKLGLPQAEVEKEFKEMRNRITDVVLEDITEDEENQRIFNRCFEIWYKKNTVAGSFEKVLNKSAADIQTAFLEECKNRNLPIPNRSSIQDRATYEWIECFLQYRDKRTSVEDVTEKLTVSRATVFNRFKEMSRYESQVQNSHKIRLYKKESDLWR